MLHIKKILSVAVLTLFAHSVWAAFSLPDYEQYTLDNGLTVFIMPHKEVPLVDVELVFKAGAVLDGKQYGLSATTVEALKFGAANQSKIELEDTLAFYGADYSSQTGHEISQLSLSFAKKDLSILLPLLADIVQRPQFNSEDFSKYKKRQLALLTQSRERPGDMIPEMFDHLYYGDHPYGQPVGGNEKTIASLSEGDVRRFYKHYLTPDNAALIIAGDFDSKQLKAIVKKQFSTWQGKHAAKKPLAVPKAPAAAKVLLVNKSDAKETTFYIGGAGITQGDKDEVALNVINTILGARFTSWLNDALRVDSGLTYGARSAFAKRQQAGLFRISSFTKTATSFEAVDLALKTYEKLWKKGLDEATLQSAKAYVKGLFPPRYETSSQLAAVLGRIWGLGLSKDLINAFEAKVDALSLAQANALAKNKFPQQNLQFVLIGKAEALREEAKKYGEVEEVDIKTFYH